MSGRGHDAHDAHDAHDVPDGSTAVARAHRAATRALVPDDQIVQWRQHLHARPELGFEEHETAAFVADTLRALDAFTVREGMGGTGVVADLPGPAGAPIVALRADMDALPIQETADVPFRSQRPGRMHACGHDGHVAMLLGAASALARQAGGPRVGVRLLFQPCEETVGADGRTGAERMVAEGALDGVQRAFALHVDPSLPLGALRLASGPVMACVETFDGTIHGAGGHGARPERSADPVRVLGLTLAALHSIVSRRVSPLDSAVVSVGRVDAGTSANVIPEHVAIQGTLRSFAPEVRDVLRSEVERAFSLAVPLGGSFTLDIRSENPALVNDAGACGTVARAARSLSRDVTIVDGPYGMLGEDFAFIARRVPAAMTMLGCAPSRASELHAPDFDLDERVLPLGAALLFEIVRVAGGDTGPGDTGSGDTGPGDTGSGDTGSGDTRAPRAAPAARGESRKAIGGR